MTTITKMTRLQEFAGQRKHGSQMHEMEIKKLVTRLKSVKNWKLSFHALDRLEAKEINATYDDIVSTIFNASIVEYRIVHNDLYNTYDERVILRSNALVNGDYNLNVVYSLTRKSVVTVWINHIEDLHSTLDWSIYNENMRVMGL